MKLSNKCRYGLRALVDLSTRTSQEYVVLATLASDNNISQQYLEQVFASLRRAGIVLGVKGAQGGYKLNRPASEIKVSDILIALDGEYKIEPESAQTSGLPAYMAIQSLVIDQINQHLDEVLKNVTLEDLTKVYIEYRDFDQSMFYI